jgi:hypothetical protein
VATRILNSTDFNGDGTDDYALCWQLECAMDGPVAAAMMLATMTQTEGPQAGFLWDPETMASYGGGSAMTRTMELFQELLPYSADSCVRPNLHFMQASCSLQSELQQKLLRWCRPTRY